MVDYILKLWQVVIISKQFCICFSESIDSVLANSADPDKMAHAASFHLGLHFLPKYPFMSFQATKG